VLVFLGSYSDINLLAKCPLWDVELPWTILGGSSSILFLFIKTHHTNRSRKAKSVERRAMVYSIVHSLCYNSLRISYWIWIVVGLQDRYSHLPSELSGGEQQRVWVVFFLLRQTVPQRCCRVSTGHSACFANDWVIVYWMRAYRDLDTRYDW